MLTYRFMQIAFITCLLLGLIIPLVGSTAVFKRLSSSGDALAHSSLAGIAIGLVSGMSPLITSIFTCVIAFLIIELLRKKFNKYSEIGVAIVLSASIGLAGILSSYTKANNFDAYLFGSILLIDDLEFYLTIGLFLIVTTFFILFYKQIFSILYSPEESKVSGIKVNLINFIMDILLSVTIAISSKIVGSLVVSSLVVLPTAIALLLKKSYKITMISSVFFSISSMQIGLTIAYYLNWKPGATIVITAIIFLLIIFVYKLIYKLIIKKIVARKY